MFYYKFNVGDWSNSTSHLTFEEEAVYRRLIDFYYRTEKPLPNDLNWLCRRLRLKEYSGHVEQVLGEFFKLEGDQWVHTRCDLEITAYQAKAEQARDNGRRGGRPPKKPPAAEADSNAPPPPNNPAGSGSVPIENPEQSESQTNHKPLTKNH